MLKIEETKFFQCPLQAISGRTWRMLEIAGETTDHNGNVVQRPYPGAYQSQPAWYRHAVRVLRNEKTAKWFNDMVRKKAEAERVK